MRPPLSVTGTRWTRWTPLSNFSLANTPVAGDVGDDFLEAADVGGVDADRLDPPALLGGEASRTCGTGRRRTARPRRRRCRRGFRASRGAHRRCRAAAWRWRARVRPRAVACAAARAPPRPSPSFRDRRSSSAASAGEFGAHAAHLLGGCARPAQARHNRGSPRRTPRPRACPTPAALRVRRSGAAIWSRRFGGDGHRGSARFEIALTFIAHLSRRATSIRWLGDAIAEYRATTESLPRSSLRRLVEALPRSCRVRDRFRR